MRQGPLTLLQKINPEFPKGNAVTKIEQKLKQSPPSDWPNLESIPHSHTKSRHYETDWNKCKYLYPTNGLSLVTSMEEVEEGNNFLR